LLGNNLKCGTNLDFKKQNNLQYDFIFNGYPEGFPLDAKQTGRKVKIENPESGDEHVAGAGPGNKRADGGVL